VISFLSQNAFWIITIVKIALLLSSSSRSTPISPGSSAKSSRTFIPLGPHRVGPHGLLQPAADGLKFLFKEDPTPLAWIAWYITWRRFSR